MKKFLILICLPLQGFSQDFTGVWTGYLVSKESQLPYELVISETKDKLTGYSLTTFSFNGVENTGIKSLKIKTKKESILIEDDELIYNNYTTASKKVTLFSTLSIEREDSNLVLLGTFFTRAVDRSSYKGTIRLQKKDNFATTSLVSQLGKMDLLGSLSLFQPTRIEKKTEPVNAPVLAKKISPITTENVNGKDNSVAGKREDEKVPVTVENNRVAVKEESNTPTVKEEPKIAPLKPERNLSPVAITRQQKVIPPSMSPPLIQATPKAIPRTVAAELASRQTEIIRSIVYQSDSLVLSLYDNGQVDGDTVSVVVNDQVIIARRGLTTNAITTTIYSNSFSGDSLRLVMYAENLGTIPPNTGLLMIQDGNERHQIRFEGDYQKNSAIILRRKQ